MSSALPQFDLGGMLRCAALDDEGYRCVKPPSHEDPHVYARCHNVDLAGHRCGLPPRHPGRHEPPWYDRNVRLGDTHTASYEGTETSANAIASRGADLFARYGWVEKSRVFKPGLIWRSPLAGPLAALLVTRPHGVVKVVFEFRPAEATAG